MMHLQREACSRVQCWFQRFSTDPDARSWWCFCASGRSRHRTTGAGEAAIARGGDAHAGCLASMIGTGLYARCFAVGVLPPSSSRAAFASFSSRDCTTSSFEAAKRVR